MLSVGGTVGGMVCCVVVDDDVVVCLVDDVVLGCVVKESSAVVIGVLVTVVPTLELTVEGGVTTSNSVVKGDVATAPVGGSIRWVADVLTTFGVVLNVVITSPVGGSKVVPASTEFISPAARRGKRVPLWTELSVTMVTVVIAKLIAGEFAELGESDIEGNTDEVNPVDSALVSK